MLFRSTNLGFAAAAAPAAGSALPGTGVALDEAENKWMSAPEAPLNGAATLSVVLLSEVAALLRSCAPAAYVVTNTRAIPKIGLIIPIVLRLSLSAPTAPWRFSQSPEP